MNNYSAQEKQILQRWSCGKKVLRKKKTMLSRLESERMNIHNGRDRQPRITTESWSASSGEHHMTLGHSFPEEHTAVRTRPVSLLFIC